MPTIPPVVLSAALGGFAIFGFIPLYFRVPWKGVSAMQRVYLSWLSGTLLWLILASQQSLDLLQFPPDARADLVCGALIVGCCAWAAFWICNLGGGFRVLMLLDLFEARRCLSRTEWMDLYGEGRGMHEFLEDRLRTILVPLGIVRIEAGHVSLTKSRGTWLGRILWVLSFVLLKRRS